LLEENGYEIIKSTMSVIPLELILEFPEGKPIMRALNWLLAVFTKVMPDLFGYQCIFAIQRRIDR